MCKSLVVWNVDVYRLSRIFLSDSVLVTSIIVVARNISLVREVLKTDFDVTLYGQAA